MVCMNIAALSQELPHEEAAGLLDLSSSDDELHEGEEEEEEEAGDADALGGAELEALGKGEKPSAAALRADGFGDGLRGRPRDAAALAALAGAAGATGSSRVSLLPAAAQPPGGGAGSGRFD
eukprot:COSAG01_NODE_9837_length_2327_cov_1.171903_1_plen_122_part_00